MAFDREPACRFCQTWNQLSRKMDQQLQVRKTGQWQLTIRLYHLTSSNPVLYHCIRFLLVSQNFRSSVAITRTTLSFCRILPCLEVFKVHSKKVNGLLRTDVSLNHFQWSGICNMLFVCCVIVLYRACWTMPDNCWHVTIRANISRTIFIRGDDINDCFVSITFNNCEINCLNQMCWEVGFVLFPCLGNSSQTSDGAAAVILARRSFAKKNNLPIIGVFRSFAVAGVPPEVMGIGPAYAIPVALERIG